MESSLIFKVFHSTLQSRDQMNALLVASKQTLPASPTRYGDCIAFQFDDTFEVFEQKRPPVFVMTTFVVTAY
jgi:hypothetical protein